MFGKNPIRKVDHAPEDGKLAVQEIFYTIQGEGPFCGQPAVFIRLAGCHLACTYCDTEFESGINNRKSVEEIVAQVRGIYPVPWFGAQTLVVITGGEPLRQATGTLASGLIDAGFGHIQYETSGNLWDESLLPLLNHDKITLVCSPKTPRLHPMVARWCKHYKYVVRAGDAAEADGLPKRGTQLHHRDNLRLARPWDHIEWDAASVTVWVSPCDEHEAAQNAANVEHAQQIAMRFGYRLSLQMHKILGLP